MKQLIPLSIKRKIAQALQLRFVNASKLQHNAMRSFSANLAQLAENEICLRVEEFAGVFEIDSRSDLFFRIVKNSNYEPELAALFASRIDPDRDIIDIGANIGFYSVLGSKKLGQGKVYAIEPVPLAFKRLQRNIDRNASGEQVALFNCGLADQAGAFKMITYEGKEEYSTFGTPTHMNASDCAKKEIELPVETLDEFVSKNQINPALIKIDVEGFEHKVFSGGLDTLRKFKPLILAEIDDIMLRNCGSSARETIALIEDCGYSAQNPFDQSKPPRMPDPKNVVFVPM